MEDSRATTVERGPVTKRWARQGNPIFRETLDNPLERNSWVLGRAWSRCRNVKPCMQLSIATNSTIFYLGTEVWHRKSVVSPLRLSVCYGSGQSVSFSVWRGEISPSSIVKVHLEEQLRVSWIWRICKWGACKESFGSTVAGTWRWSSWIHSIWLSNFSTRSDHQTLVLHESEEMCILNDACFNLASNSSVQRSDKVKWYVQSIGQFKATSCQWQQMYETLTQWGTPTVKPELLWW